MAPRAAPPERARRARGPRTSGAPEAAHRELDAQGAERATASGRPKRRAEPRRARAGAKDCTAPGDRAARSSAKKPPAPAPRAGERQAAKSARTQDAAPKGTIKNLGHASRGRRPKSAGAIKARTKAAKMAEQQAQAEHRERLRKLLTQKLTAKHGPGKKQAIKQNVDQFVSSNTAVSELELKKLDKLVEDKNTIDKVWPSARPSQEVKPAAGSAVQVIKQKESLSRSETPELTQEIDRHSKWKVLNAYSALKNEDSRPLRPGTDKKKNTARF